jgi:SAM-dependent methyltransferase
MEKYYKEVGEYYDKDVELGFEKRADTNTSLQRIRGHFRTYVSKQKFTNALEIGCGPGLDAEWFGQSFPDKKLHAIDVSAEMAKTADGRTSGFGKVRVSQATEHDLSDLPNAPFDMTYVFFGALNTVNSLPDAADRIYSSMQPGGVAVLTFVNKWYMRELLVNLLKLRFKVAFARIRTVWGGYSNFRFLASRCYTPSNIRKAFKSFNELDHRGYSILFPAWYNHHKIKGNNDKANRLWEFDEKLNKTPLWQFGEYTLFVFQKPA